MWSDECKSWGGFEYFISFIDDYSRYGYLYLMEHKSEAFKKFKEYKAKVENILNKKIKIFWSDRGGEYADISLSMIDAYPRSSLILNPKPYPRSSLKS